MKQEKKERYMRLLDLINNTYRDGDHPPFTPEEKREFGEILADNMTPYEFHRDVCSVGNVCDDILNTYCNLDDYALSLEFINIDNYTTVDGWIKKNGLPLPDREYMIEYIIDNINIENYINGYYEDILDLLLDQCEFRLNDGEIIHLFEVYVEEPESDERVICDAANRFKCVGDDCYHAIPHNINKACDELDCDKYKIEVKCIPVEVE